MVVLIGLVVYFKIVGVDIHESAMDGSRASSGVSKTARNKTNLTAFQK